MVRSPRGAAGPAPGLLDAVLALLGGVALTAATPLICIILGIGVVTLGYFGAHSVASSWVSRRGGAARAQAAAFYLFFLYVGSSVLGSAGGIAWSRAGWPGVALFTGVLVMAALLIALRLIAVKPLPEIGSSDRGGRAQEGGSSPQKFVYTSRPVAKGT